MRQRLAQLQVALMLLTRLPAGQLAPPVPGLGAAAWAFPLVGLVVGAIAAATMAAALWLPLPPIIAAGLAVAASVLVTGGLHEDGLADVADGFGGGRGRERKLAIMRDSRIGSYGTLALILVIGLRWQAIAAAPPAQSLLALLAIAAASRAGLPAVMRLMPAARADGLGKAAAGGHWQGATLAALIGLAALVAAFGATDALLIAWAMAITILATAGLAMRQIGGQTGDVLGSMQQLSELAAWLAVLVLAHP